MIGILAAAVVAATTLPPGAVLPGEQGAYDAMIAEQARAADATFGGSPCGDAGVEVVAVVPWTVVDHPDTVFWREKVRVTGCGRKSVENLNVRRMGGSPP